jgi:rsbT antagonist protein RsbS
MRTPILKQGRVLIATMQSDPSDADLAALREELAKKVGEVRARGVILDVTKLDVIDSYGVRLLRTIVHTTRLRGAHSVVVGIQPEVAIAMMHLGLTLDQAHLALDLEDGLELMERLQARSPGERDGKGRRGR